jgi:hypothetical protein
MCIIIRDWNLFQNLGFQEIGSGTLFTNLGFRPEPVPGTLEILGFLRVPEPAPVPVGLERVTNDSAGGRFSDR